MHILKSREISTTSFKSWTSLTLPMDYADIGFYRAKFEARKTQRKKLETLKMRLGKRSIYLSRKCNTLCCSGCCSIGFFGMLGSIIQKLGFKKLESIWLDRTLAESSRCWILAVLFHLHGYSQGSLTMLNFVPKITLWAIVPTVNTYSLI